MKDFGRQRAASPTTDTVLKLFGSEGFDGFFLSGGAGRNYTRDKGQHDAYCHKNDRHTDGQGCAEGCDARQGKEDGIDGDAEQIGYYNAQQACCKADEHGFCIEYARNIALGCTDGAEDSDLLGAFLNRDEGDDTYHYGGYYK